MWNSSPLRLGPESKHDELSFLQKSTVLLYEGKTISGKETEQLEESLTNVPERNKENRKIII